MPKMRTPAAYPTNIREFGRFCDEALPDGTIATADIADNAVTLPKLATVATDTLLGRSTSGTGAVETIPCTAAGRAVIAAANAGAQRTVLSLGTASTSDLGASGATVPLLNGANLHSSARCTLFSVGSATPIGTQAANPDTSGAVLADVEAELNQIKQVLRDFGLIAT